MKYIDNFILVFCCLVFTTGITQTHIWIGDSNANNWHNALNWNTKTIPTSSSDVLISENSNVSISQTDVEVNSIQLSPNASLTLDTNLTVTQYVSLTIHASLIWKSSTLSVNTIENNGSISIETFDTKVLHNTTINNYGTIAINSSGVINLLGSTVIHNNSSGVLAIDSNGGMVEQSESTAVINNDGLVEKTPAESGGAFYMILDMHNSGIIDVGDNQTFLFLVSSQNFNNLDTGILQGNGSFDITSNFTNTGTISPGAMATLGSLEIVNNFSLSDTAKLIIDIDGPEVENHDFLSVFGSPELHGTLVINLNYEAAIGDSFTILNAALGIDSCGFPEQVTVSFNEFNYTFDVNCYNNEIQLEVADVTLSIETFNPNTSNFFLAPNPINDSSKFVLPEHLNSAKTTIHIYNYLGQKLLTSSATQMTIQDLVNLESGLYFAQLTQRDKIIATTRFIIP